MPGGEEYKIKSNRLFSVFLSICLLKKNYSKVAPASPSLIVRRAERDLVLGLQVMNNLDQVSFTSSDILDFILTCWA